MIMQSLSKRPTERIGKFNVSPRGGKDFRVAWHFEYNNATDTITITQKITVKTSIFLKFLLNFIISFYLNKNSL